MNRDWDRTNETVRVLKEDMGCGRKVIVAPYENELARAAKEEIRSNRGKIRTLKKLSPLIL